MNRRNGQAAAARRTAGWTSRLAGCLALLLAPALPTEAAGAAAGQVVYTRGAASLQDTSGVMRVAGKGDPVMPGEVLSTGERSFAVLELTDETRVVLRPKSRFAVEAWETDAGKEEGLLSLFEGGFRAVTGFLNKRRQGAVRVRSSTATIGIRGTDFAARVCTGDCSLPVHQRPTSPTAAAEAPIEWLLLEVGAASPTPASPPGSTGPTPQSLNGDEPGLHVSVFDGEVEVTTPDGVVVLGVGDDGYVGPNDLPVTYESPAPVARVDTYTGIDPLANPSDWDGLDPGAGSSGQCSP